MAEADLAYTVYPTGRCADPLPVPQRTPPALATLALVTLAYGLRDAQRCRNRLTAANALRWLRARSNWTKVPLAKRLAKWGTPGPPSDVRSEYVLSFSWCCQVLDLDEEQVRQHGLPVAMGQTWVPRGGLSDWRTWRQHRDTRRIKPAGLFRMQCRYCGREAITKPSNQVYCDKSCAAAAVTHAAKWPPICKRYALYRKFAVLVNSPVFTEQQWNVLCG